MAKTLLLADDSVTIQKVVSISFASENVQIVTVDNGDDAILKARELRPDVILADVVMPGKNGYEVCEAIKADASLRGVPVLLLTGTFETFDAERAAQAGAAGHVAKPFEAQTLVDQVNQLLAGPVTPAAPPAPTATPAPSAAAPQAAPSADPLEPLAAAPPGAGPRRSEEAFDFFDDTASELTEAAGDALPAADAGADALEFDSPDSAFAFGDDELSPLPQEPLPSAPLSPGAKPTPAEATVAIVPEAPPADATVAIVPEAPLATPTTAPVDAGDLTVIDPAILEPRDDFAVGPNDTDPLAEDPLEFAFEAAPSASPPTASDVGSDLGSDVESDVAALAPGEATDDLAGAALLDPDRSGDFAVSSSDLGSTLTGAYRIGAAPSEPAQPLATADVAPPAPVPLEPDEPTPPAIREPRFEAEAPVEPAPRALPDTEPEIRSEPPPAALPVQEVEAVTLGDPLPDPEPEPQPAPEARPQPEPEAQPAAPSVDTEQVLERIGPALRGQLHETLEKTAWDAFGQVTEQIVEKAVERVEAIAWEVIPQLAETLIREEIRKLQGEEENETR